MKALLNLHGEVFIPCKDYVVRFDVREVKPTPARPHGISYSLVMLYKGRDRVLGYDNRDPYKEPDSKGKFRSRRILWDHVHKHAWVFPYDFTDPLQLMDDFWNSAFEIIENDKKEQQIK